MDNLGRFSPILLTFCFFSTLSSMMFRNLCKLRQELRNAKRAMDRLLNGQMKLDIPKIWDNH